MRSEYFVIQVNRLLRGARQSERQVSVAIDLQQPFCPDNS